MAVIGVGDYKAIVRDYEVALTQIEGVSVNYFNAAYKVLFINRFDPEIDLLVAFHNAYLVADSSFAAQPQSVVNAVTVLQNHVLALAVDSSGVKFTDVNAWFADVGGFTGFFTSGFASLSAQAGHTITSTYIQ